MSNINFGTRDFVAEIDEKFSDLFKRATNYLSESCINHISDKDLEEAEKIPAFVEATKESYDIGAYEEYLDENIKRVLSAAGVYELKETLIYSFIKESMPEILEKFTLENLFHKEETRERHSSVKFHKITVYQKACEECLCKKDVTFNTALKHVCEKELKGIPAYRQIISTESDNFEKSLIKEIRSWVDYVKENDKALCLRMWQSSAMRVLGINS